MKTTRISNINPICKLVNFELFRTPSLRKDKKISQKPFTPNNFIERNNTSAFRRKKKLGGCKQAVAKTIRN